MKTRVPLTLLLIFLSLMVAHDNPLIPRFLSELVVGQGADWRMELFFSSPENLNGWGVASQTDTAYFKTGRIGGPGYYVFTGDSLQKPLVFSRTAEKVVLVTPFGSGGTVVYGNLPNSLLTAPRSGQSICYLFGAGFYYLDSTPTLGSANDTANGMGEIDGLVTDTLGVPLGDVGVSDPLGGFLLTDSLGRFGFRDYARQQTLWFSRGGYNSRQVIVQMYPDSVVRLTVKLSVVVSVHQWSATLPERVRLLPGYPNPFNPVTAVCYELPRTMEVRLTVFDMQGRSVAILVDGRREAGFHRSTFDGSGLPSGIYFCRLQAERVMQVSKLVLLR